MFTHTIYGDPAEAQAQVLAAAERLANAYATAYKVAYQATGMEHDAHFAALAVLDKIS